MEVNSRVNRTWWWVAGVVAMLSVTGCSIYPAHPGQWPAGGWGDVLKFVSSVIDFFAKHLGGNYGISLLVVTVLVRLLILPLMIKQIRYQKVMQAVQPELQKIRQKYKGDAQKINEETMKLWQQRGINPMSGCFPVVVQLPVLYALFGAIEGNVRLNSSTFLGIFHLGSPDHLYILPLLAAATTYLSSRMVMNAQDPQQKIMLWVMPVFIFLIGARFPSGLALYWIYSNLFQTVQTYFVRVRPANTVAVLGTGPGGGDGTRESSKGGDKPSLNKQVSDNSDAATLPKGKQSGEGGKKGVHSATDGKKGK